MDFRMVSLSSLLITTVPKRLQIVNVTIPRDVSWEYKGVVLSQKWGVGGQSQTVSFLVERSILSVRIKFLARPLEY